MHAFVLIPDNDPKQALRIRHFLTAAGSSLLLVLLLALGYSQGMVASRLLMEAAVIVGALIALFYAVFRSGINRRCPEPSLTLVQIVLSTATLVYFTYQAESMRGVLLTLYPMPLLFAQFRLNWVRLLLLALLMLFAYAGIVLLSAYAKPANADGATEVVLFVALCAVLPWYAAMAGYLRTLRERVSASKIELRQTLDALQQTNQALQASHAELDRLAGTDRLTGAWNRRRMDEAVAGEMGRLKRYAHPLSVLVIDIDFFKKVNDQYGHAAGDKLLVELSAQVQSSLRGADSLTRWGGEEFVVLCPNTALLNAVLFAERLRKTIAGMDSSAPKKVTVSIGVAECLPGETWEQWFHRADVALLRAKDLGRNQVQSAPETPARTGGGEIVRRNLVQLVWNADYECGHEAVDRHHKILFNDSNDLLGAIFSGRPADEVAAIVDTLFAHVVRHFRDEEAIITAAGYPGAATHASMHRELVDRAGVLVKAFRAGTGNVGEMFQFLAEDVIAAHLLGADRDFFPYLRNAAR